jgi:hypothetical protein
LRDNASVLEQAACLGNNCYREVAAATKAPFHCARDIAISSIGKSAKGLATLIQCRFHFVCKFPRSRRYGSIVHPRLAATPP